MRFLGVSETCDLGSLYLRLIEDGHDVHVAIADKAALGTMSGMVPRVDDWRAELPWIREAGREGVILFESVSEGLGSLQDALRQDGYQVIGGSAYGDRLENDRAYGQDLLASLGFPAGHVWEFDDHAKADAFIAQHPKRYVLKLSGAAHTANDTYVGQSHDGRDVRAMLRARRYRGAKFILMERIEGVEMGIGAYFDGDRFITPACLDWEHKRFFAGDLGELTGEMGTVATFDRSEAFFDRTLALLEPRFRGKQHIGYVNLNTIVNAQGIWPLEFTCRFGYPGFAILDPLQKTRWAELFRLMLKLETGSFVAHPGFSVGIVVTTPPFPYTRDAIDTPIGLPVLFDGEPTKHDTQNIHYGEVGMLDGQLVTSGLFGWTMVVTGVGSAIADARRDAYERVARFTIPNARYRLDIGDRLISGDWDIIEQLGALSP
ncbi:MAG: phosphoribosylamine--glycine ligase [Clostridia bacterium]|nr:phosphoribosylamine--glycine ligase [Deltaproteobacteria bacterium]